MKDSALIELSVFVYLFFFKKPVKNASIDDTMRGSGKELRPSSALNSRTILYLCQFLILFF